VPEHLVDGFPSIDLVFRQGRFGLCRDIGLHLILPIAADFFQAVSIVIDRAHEHQFHIDPMCGKGVLDIHPIKRDLGVSCSMVDTLA
jgi:hypothetical protein